MFGGVGRDGYASRTAAVVDVIITGFLTDDQPPEAEAMQP
jgi:hypothetical protein